MEIHSNSPKLYYGFDFVLMMISKSIYNLQLF